MKSGAYVSLRPATSDQRPATSDQRPASCGVRALSVLLLLVAQPAWAETAEHSGDAIEAISPVTQDMPSSKVDLLLTEYQALSERVAALEDAAAQPRQSNDKWFSVGIVLLGAVTLIHALRLRRLK